MKTLTFSNPDTYGLKCLALALAAGAAFLAGTAMADTTIAANGTFTIDNGDTTVVGTTTTWNDTGTLTINNGGTLQTWPNQNEAVVNNDAIVFTGAGGTISLKFNGNDTDHMLAGAITSTATGAQTLALYTGYNGNGDRESVTFNAGIPNVGDNSALGLNVTYKCQTGSQSWVNLPAVNNFTGPITLVAGGGPATGYLTIGGTLTRYHGNTFGSGTLNSGNYPGDISLGASTNLNYASTAPQTLAGVISGAGSVQVTGSGTVTLSRMNTYTGSTTVNGGTLILQNGGGLTFEPTDTASNKITGTGTANLNGAFTIDTSAVSLATGSWTLVDVATKTYGGTFSVTGFDPPVSGVWTKVAGAKTWTFDQTTGLLSVSGPALFTSFSILGSTGVIDDNTMTVRVWLPNGTDLANLVPTYTVSTGTGAPASDISHNFSNPATYTITDGAIVNSYTVSIILTTTFVINLGISPDGTFFEGNNEGAYTPVSLGTLPTGSILRAVDINAKLESTDNDNWAAELVVLFDTAPGTPSGHGLLELGAYYIDLGSAEHSIWANGYDGPGTSVIDSKIVGVDFTPDIDLGTAGLFLVNGYGGPVVGGTWSGTITLTYDLVVPPSDYGDWLKGYTFAPGADTSPTGDPDGDGLTNFQEYAFGLNPTSGSSVNPITVPLDKSTGTFSYTRRATPATTGLTYTVWTSTDLANWTKDAGAVEGTVTTADGVETVPVTISSGLLNESKLFIRVIASDVPAPPVGG